MNKFNQFIMATKLANPDLSVVILCYKSGELSRQFVDMVRALFSKEKINDYELVLVGNYLSGTDDITPLIVKEISFSCDNVQCVAEEKRGMMGWDMKSGLSLAKGRYIAVIDGDGQMPIEDLARAYKEIVATGADLVKTYRFKRGDSLLRKLISLSYNLFFRLLFPGLGAKDINSKPKIFTQAAYRKLKLSSDDWFIDAEIMIQARRLCFKIVEIPTVFLGLTGRRSFVGLKAVAEFIKNLVIYRIKEFFN